jgi:hypothetical protein
MKDKLIELYLTNKELVVPITIMILVILLIFSGPNDTKA